MLVLERGSLRLGVLVGAVQRIEGTLAVASRTRSCPRSGELVEWVTEDGRQLGLVDPEGLIERGVLLLTELRSRQEWRTGAMANRVLIADDAAFMREMLRDILTDGGYEVVGEAADGNEAVSAFAKHNPDLRDARHRDAAQERARGAARDRRGAIRARAW